MAFILHNQFFVLGRRVGRAARARRNALELEDRLKSWGVVSHVLGRDTEALWADDRERPTKGRLLPGGG